MILHRVMTPSTATAGARSMAISEQGGEYSSCNKKGY
jgi:hypothetical protein